MCALVVLWAWAVCLAPASTQDLATIAGRVVDDQGAPVPGARIRLVGLVFDPCCGADHHLQTDSAGAFSVEAAPARYALSVDPRFPYDVAQRRIDARAGSVTGLTVQVRRRAFSYLPDEPPIAERIRLSSPDGDGRVEVTGEPGAVPAGAFVLLVTLETEAFGWTEADAAGGFSVTHPAPAGSSILIKADPVGVVLYSAVFESTFGGEGSSAAASGTIMRVPEPPATGPEVPVAGAGTFCSLGSPDFRFVGAMDPVAPVRGGELRVRGTLTVQSVVLEEVDELRVDGGLSLEMRFRADGVGGLPRAFFTSDLLTPTDLPIERGPRFGLGPGTGSQLAMSKVDTDRFEGGVDLLLPIPHDVPEGVYQVVLTFFAHDSERLCERVPEEPRLLTDKVGRHPPDNLFLRFVTLGDPAPPRLFLTLLTDDLSNGSPGVTALEDEGSYELTTRVVTRSETYVVPRLDPLSGRPYRYRLEPFAPQVAAGDRGVPPHPPFVPFRFPSGELTVRLLEPDGEVRILGPAPFVQPRLRTLVRRDGLSLDFGGGHLTEVLQLSTLNPSFGVELEEDGLHVVELEATIEDVWGNVWSGGGTYRIWAARPLSLDTAVLPGTPFELGDALSTGVVVTPPVPADVEIRFRLASGPRGDEIVEQRVQGRANRFGHFQLAQGAIPLADTGEYRLDVTASYETPEGELWMGSRTFGSVVARRAGPLVAHGRRGTDNELLGPQWFFRSETDFPGDIGHVFYPFHSGDVTWQVKTDAALPIVSVQDLGGELSGLILERGGDQNLEVLAPAGEMPLMSSAPGGDDPHLDLSAVDLWAYSYRSVQRPLVRVREQIGEETSSLYWRFFEEYGRQIGAGDAGDLPEDFKLQYGAAVARGRALAEPLYAIYASLFVLVPDSEPNGGGTRTMPPFQGNGGGPSGGPIMTLRGREIDLFVHLTGARPGSVLEVGDTFSLSGAVAPPLPARVSYVVTSPGGVERNFTGLANRVGWYARPEHDFTLDEPGRWEVTVEVLFDGVTSAGPVSEPHPTGDVLGTEEGRFSFYVVEPDAPPLDVDLPAEDFLAEWEPVVIEAALPADWEASTAHVTATIPGFVIEDRELAMAGGRVVYTWDPAAHRDDFRMLDPADVVTLSLFAEGEDQAGARHQRARIVTLHGQHLLAPAQEPTPDLPPPPPSDEYLTSEAVPGYRFQVRITSQQGIQIMGSAEPECIAETLCVSGAVAGRAEVFLRVVGPKPNGRMWPTLVKFTTSEVEVWVEQEGTGVRRYYRLAGARPGFDELPGRFDREGFQPLGRAGSGTVRAVEPFLGTRDAPPPPTTQPFVSPAVPGYRFWVQITNQQGTQIPARSEPECIAETLCVSGAVAGRSEVFVRVVGPKPNGRMWPTLVRFSTSTIEVWVEQEATGDVRYYRLEGASPGVDDLTGLFDRDGFRP